MEEKDLDLNLDELDQIEASADGKLQVRNRFQQLANDKRTLAQEKDELTKQKVEAEAKIAQLEKQSEFHKNFSKVSAKFPEATNYQDQILERVNKGIDLEEATAAVLFKEGKLGNQVAQPVQRPVQAEGGSAVTNVSSEEKPLSEMPMSEKLAALQEMEKSGELTQMLRAGINRS